MKKILLIISFILFAGLKSYSQSPNQVTLYPNPASSSVNITFSSPSKSEVTVVISDILGNKIETLKYASDEVIYIDLASLKP
jgi:hypothetical protein